MGAADELRFLKDCLFSKDHEGPHSWEEHGTPPLEARARKWLSQFSDGRGNNQPEAEELVRELLVAMRPSAAPVSEEIAKLREEMRARIQTGCYIAQPFETGEYEGMSSPAMTPGRYDGLLEKWAAGLDTLLSVREPNK